MEGTAPQSEVLDVKLTVVGDIPPQEGEAARLALASLERYAGRPMEAARLTLRRGGGGFPDREYVADASILFGGRLLAAHTAGPKPSEAAEAAVERLRRQLRRVVDADVAQRNEPAVIQKALAGLEHDERNRPAQLKPPEHRRIVRRRTYADRPEATLEAIADLLDVDLEFLLFRHVRTDEDVVSIGAMTGGSPSCSRPAASWLTRGTSSWRSRAGIRPRRRSMTCVRRWTW